MRICKWNLKEISVVRDNMTNVVSVMFVNVKTVTLFFFFLKTIVFTSQTNNCCLFFFLLLHRLYGSSFCLLFWDLLPLSCKCHWSYSTHTHTPMVSAKWLCKEKSHEWRVFTTVSLLLQDCEISSKEELLLLFFRLLFFKPTHFTLHTTAKKLLCVQWKVSIETAFLWIEVLNYFVFSTRLLDCIYFFPPLSSFCPNLSAISSSLRLTHNVAVSFLSIAWTLPMGCSLKFLFDLLDC